MIKRSIIPNGRRGTRVTWTNRRGVRGNGHVARIALRNMVTPIFAQWLYWHRVGGVR